jgi:hypothetical protein
MRPFYNGRPRVLGTLAELYRRQTATYDQIRRDYGPDVRLGQAVIGVRPNSYQYLAINSEMMRQYGIQIARLLRMPALIMPSYRPLFELVPILMMTSPAGATYTIKRHQRLRRYVTEDQVEALMEPIPAATGSDREGHREGPGVTGTIIIPNRW